MRLPILIEGLFSESGLPIPLMGVRVEGDLIGRGAEVRVFQRFKNRESKALEAVYKFPIPEGAAVTGFLVEKDGARISGTVEERDKAFERYDDALQAGKGGYLLDEERPNVFTLSVGNLNPGAEAVVRIDYVTLMDEEADTLRFFLPMTITPRYMPNTMKEDGDIPTDHLLHPPYAASVPYGMEMTLTLFNADAFSAIESPSHPLRIAYLPENRVAVTFSKRSVKMDRDFVLNLTLWDPSADRACACRDDRGIFMALDLCLEDNGRGATREPEEDIVFVVDRSGSMEGSSLAEARRALEICLKALAQGRRFNILGFGSRFVSLFPDATSYSEATLQKALHWCRAMRADLGGTEILQPLKHIYSPASRPHGKKGVVFLLTDGAVGNEAEVLSLVRNERHLRMFAVGIGAGCNEAFIKGLARAGRGASAFVYPGERMEAKVLRLFGKMTEEALEPSIDWGHPGSEQTPSCPVVYRGARTSLFARLEAGVTTPSEVRVTVPLAAGSRTWTVPVAPIDDARQTIPLLWAREKIRELEDREDHALHQGSVQTERKTHSIRKRVISLSREFGLLSRYTSFVAIEERKKGDLTTGEIELRKVSSLVTQGWHGLETGVVKMHESAGPVPRAMNFAGICQGAEPCQRSPSRGPVRPSSKQVQEEVRGQVRPLRWSPEPPEELMRILALQRAEGGFEYEPSLARRLGIDPDALYRFEEAMGPCLHGQALLILWSLLILRVLACRYADHEDVWLSMVRKTRKWVQAISESRQKPVLGRPLLRWIEAYAEELFRLLAD